MNDYARVAEALKQGVTPSELCASCPWDRHCVHPPDFSAQDIEQGRQEAIDSVEDEQGKLFAALLGLAVFAGRELLGETCPVFAVRLRSSGGRRISDTLKAAMRSWTDNQVEV